LLLAPDASGLLVVVSPVRRESALLGEVCSDATGGGAEDAGWAGADATGAAAETEGIVGTDGRVVAPVPRSRKATSSGGGNNRCAVSRPSAARPTVTNAAITPTTVFIAFSPRHNGCTQGSSRVKRVPG
jgi:hypothetical protein